MNTLIDTGQSENERQKQTEEFKHQSRLVSFTGKFC